MQPAGREEYTPFGPSSSMIASSPDPAQDHDEADTTLRALAALSPDFTPPESYSVPPPALRCILDILVRAASQHAQAAAE
jgi:hypothetical protein